MTKQEAIETIKLALSQVEWDYPLDYAAAFDMAISALEKQDVPDTNVGNMISRQDAIDAHCELCEDRGRCNCDICPDVEVFQLLPSAQSEKRTENTRGAHACDCIDRQAAIDKITEYGSGDVTCMSVGELKRRIEALPSTQPEQRWIPCSERLPEDDTEVFVYLFDRPSPYIAWFCDGCWFTEDFQVEKEDYPKAWMPLPQPYTGRREE